MWQGSERRARGAHADSQLLRKRLKQLFARFAPNPEERKWVGVLDSSILVNAVKATHDNSPAVRVVEAGIAGLYVCVLSESIRNETNGVLQRLGHPMDEVAAVLDPLWSAATWVPLGTEAPRMLDTVRDPGDVHVLRCAMGIYEHRQDLSDSQKFLISDNTRHFKEGWNFYGFEFISAHKFWLRLIKPS